MSVLGGLLLEHFMTSRIVNVSFYLHGHLTCSFIYPRTISAWRGGDPGAVVKAACLEIRKSRARTPLWHLSFKETKCYFPAHL